MRGIENFSTGKPESISSIRDRTGFRKADLLDLGRCGMPAEAWITCRTRQRSPQGHFAGGVRRDEKGVAKPQDSVTARPAVTDRDSV